MTTDTDLQRDRIVDAFIGRLATRPFGEVELADVAADAEVTLADLRRQFASRMAILRAFVQRIDVAVLAGDDPQMADQPPRERLFDVLMRRLELLEPYRPAVRSLRQSVRTDPGLGVALNGLLVQSMGYMLAAAKVSMGGARGRFKAQGLALSWAGIVDAWLSDTDPGLARTMVAVDRALARGERALDVMDKVCGGLSRLDERLRGFRDRRRPAEPGPQESMAGEGI